MIVLAVVIASALTGRAQATGSAGTGVGIAFTSNRDGNREVYVMNADGSDQRNLTRNPAGDGFDVTRGEGSPSDVLGGSASDVSQGANTLAAFIVLGVFLFDFAIPAYVIGRKRRVSNSGIAFIPLVGPIIVVLRAARISAWWSLLIFAPLGVVVLIVWVAIVLPR